MKVKINFDLPSGEKLIEGLTPEGVYPQLAKARAAAEAAKEALARRREELAKRERVVAELPSQIISGKASESALTEALRARDVAAALVPAAQVQYGLALEYLANEEKFADVALEKEVAARKKPLEELFKELDAASDEVSNRLHTLFQLRERERTARLTRPAPGSTP